MVILAFIGKICYCYGTRSCFCRVSEWPLCQHVQCWHFWGKESCRQYFVCWMRGFDRCQIIIMCIEVYLRGCCCRRLVVQSCCYISIRFPVQCLVNVYGRFLRGGWLNHSWCSSLWPKFSRPLPAGAEWWPPSWSHWFCQEVPESKAPSRFGWTRISP